MSDRVRWSDDQLDREFDRVNRRINSLPDRVTVMEVEQRATREDLKDVRDDVKDVKREVKEMHGEFTASQRGMSRGEKWVAAGVFAAFIGSAASAVALLSGAL